MDNQYLDFFLNENISISPKNFIINLLFALILSFLIRLVYLKFSTSLSNKNEFSKNFVILGLTTCIVITIVKSSLALSLGLVEIRGWDAYSTKEAKLECREMGVVGDYSFYGSSAYYRGIDPFIASIKYFRLLIKFGFNTSWKYIKGYFGSYIKGDKRLENKELRNYFSKISYKRALQELKLSFQKNKK